MPSRSTTKQFEALLRPHLDSLYRLAFRLTMSRVDAEDLVQDVLAKLLPRCAEMQKLANLYPWLARVLYHQFVDDTRRLSRSPLHLVVSDDEFSLAEQPAENAADPFNKMVYSRDQQQLINAVERLADEHRVVIIMHDIEGYTLADIADILACPVGTVKSRLHRARARLRELLGSYSLLD